MDIIDMFMCVAFVFMLGIVAGSQIVERSMKPKRDPNTGRFIKG